MTRHRPDHQPTGAAADAAYLDELTVHLRLAELPGADIGDVLEEVRDHLAQTGDSARAAFGPAAEYAGQIAVARGAPEVGPLGMGRTDLLAAALQILAWFVAIYSGVAWLNDEPLTLGIGHLAGLLVLIAGFVWPVWPSLRAHTAGRVGWSVPAASLFGTAGLAVAAMTIWHTPTLLTVPAPVATAVAALVIIGCWVRVHRLRDPVRRPTTAG